MKLTLDPPVFTYDPRLVLRAFIRWERGGYGVMPTPDEITDIDTAWESDIYVMMDWFKFHRDWHKRPKGMQDIAQEGTSTFNVE